MERLKASSLRRCEGHEATVITELCRPYKEQGVFHRIGNAHIATGVHHSS